MNVTGFAVADVSSYVENKPLPPYNKWLLLPSKVHRELNCPLGIEWVWAGKLVCAIETFSFPFLDPKFLTERLELLPFGNELPLNPNGKHPLKSGILKVVLSSPSPHLEFSPPNASNNFEYSILFNSLPSQNIQPFGHILPYQ